MFSGLCRLVSGSFRDLERGETETMGERRLVGCILGV